MHAFDLMRSAPVRYALAFAGISTAVMGVLLLVIYLSMISLLERHLDEAIEQHREVLRSEFKRGGREAVVRLIRQHEARRQESPVHYLMRDRAGAVIAGDATAVEAHAGWQDIAVPSTGDSPAGMLRAYGEHFDSDTFVLVTHDMQDLHQTRELIIASFGIALGLTVVLALAGGVMIGRTMLRRVEDINRTARAIMEGDLSRRVPMAGTRDEFGGLADSLNRMLARIQELMENVQQVSNDIAHDLRTPLGRLRQRLEACRRKPQTGAAYEAAIDGAIAESATILETFDALLRIAQIEAGVRRARFTSVALDRVVDNVVEAFSAAADDDGKRLVREIDSGLELHGDRELLTQMLANVVENSLRHTPRGTCIEVRAELDGGHVRLTVSDDGPGIGVEERERVLRRFYRLDASRATPGSGLGLSLVAAVVKLHEAELSLDDNAPGLRVTIRFPPSGASLDTGAATPEAPVGKDRIHAATAGADSRGSELGMTGRGRA